ncbi:hypothetical protein [Larkinella terrae]|uniref:Uncharacterized protein n=1 Tax=Larkinella terrae TaxID=2025311 RepID=A0A7K0ENI0_9BACT|nr:hypothetical protein [Larkinella terrae]MRS63377.1 hypothetical protein [Larkinella terrae]
MKKNLLRQKRTNVIGGATTGRTPFPPGQQWNQNRELENPEAIARVNSKVSVSFI